MKRKLIIYASLILALFIIGRIADKKMPRHLSAQTVVKKSDAVKKTDVTKKSDSTDKKSKTDKKISGDNKVTTPGNNYGYTNNDKKTVVKKESLFATVRQGGILMIFLVLLGIASLTIAIERIIYYTKNKVWKNDQLEADLNKIADESKAKFSEDLEDELRNAFQVYSNNMEKGLTLLSGIGNISPIVGFLGTVIGMISAFASIAAATTVNAKVVAVGIQIALVTTAGGLFVAAPTLAFFYFFNHIMQNRYAFAESTIVDLCEKRPRMSLNFQDRNQTSYSEYTTGE